jgi:peptidoglycan/LPS O-acetylase OafA/YrhL
MAMTITNSARWREWRPRRYLRPHRGRTESYGPAAILAGAAAIGAAAWLYLARVLPADALLPAICALLFVLAAVAAVVAWTRPQSGAGPFTYWDVAGVLMLISVCAAAAVEPDQMVRLVEGSRQP